MNGLTELAEVPTLTKKSDYFAVTSGAERRTTNAEGISY
jgi:hypothetical protein